MLTSDEASKINVEVHYMPENDLSHNDPKIFTFSFSIEPDYDAEYPGGRHALNQYINEQLVGKVPQERFRQHQLAAVTFAIDEKGNVVDTQLSWSTEDDEVDEQLMKAICNMPAWRPAEYSNGLKVKQEYALTAGDMNSCVVNLINIRKMPRQ